MTQLPSANQSNQQSKDNCKGQCEAQTWCTNFTYEPDWTGNNCFLFDYNDATYGTNATYECTSSYGAVSGWYS